MGSNVLGFVFFKEACKIVWGTRASKVVHHSQYDPLWLLLVMLAA